MTPRNKREANLKPFDTLSPEECYAIHSKGGKAQRKKASERKKLRELVADLLDHPARLANGKTITLPDGTPLDNMRLAVVAATLRSALKGDVKAAQTIFEWSGEVGQKAEIENNIVINVSES